VSRKISHFALTLPRAASPMHPHFPFMLFYKASLLSLLETLQTTAEPETSCHFLARTKPRSHKEAWRPSAFCHARLLTYYTAEHLKRLRRIAHFVASWLRASQNHISAQRPAISASPPPCSTAHGLAKEPLQNIPESTNFPCPI
jgi:hypothetical protein